MKKTQSNFRIYPRSKKLDLKSKQLVLEFLWKIILSDDKSDVYESTLMRRICGLLYLPDKLSGEIKSNILKRKKYDIHCKRRMCKM